MNQDFTWAELGSRIRDLRIALEWSQQALADKASITQAGLARIETGQTNPQLDTLRQIAEGLGTSVRQLLTGNTVETGGAANPLIRRIVRVLDSGDADAIETIANAVDTAETLLRRSGRVVADFGSAALSRKNQKQAEIERLRKIARVGGWDLPGTSTGKVSTSRAKYSPVKTQDRLATTPQAGENLVTKPRKGFRAGD